MECLVTSFLHNFNDKFGSVLLIFDFTPLSLFITLLIWVNVPFCLSYTLDVSLIGPNLGRDDKRLIHCNPFDGVERFRNKKVEVRSLLLYISVPMNFYSILLYISHVKDSTLRFRTSFGIT